MTCMHHYNSLQLEGFDRYKYSCKDTSPLSNYVLHPFWNKVVTFCPINIAPNLLTLVGFICCLGHYIIPAIFVSYSYNDAKMIDSNIELIISFCRIMILRPQISIQIIQYHLGHGHLRHSYSLPAIP